MEKDFLHISQDSLIPRNLPVCKLSPRQTFVDPARGAISCYASHRCSQPYSAASVCLRHPQAPPVVTGVAVTEVVVMEEAATAAMFPAGASTAGASTTGA